MTSPESAIHVTLIPADNPLVSPSNLSNLRTPNSHTITRLTYYYPPHLAISSSSSQSPPSSHFTGTQQDVTQLLFRGRKRVRVASYVSIGRSPLPFFPLSTSSTSLHIDYPPRTRYLFLSSPRMNGLPLTPTSWAWGKNLLLTYTNIGQIFLGCLRAKIFTTSSIYVYRPANSPALRGRLPHLDPSPAYPHWTPNLPHTDHRWVWSFFALEAPVI